MGKYGEDIEQFREDVENVAKEMIVAVGRSQNDELLLAEIWFDQNGVDLPTGFLKEVLDSLAPPE